MWSWYQADSESVGRESGAPQELLWDRERQARRQTERGAREGAEEDQWVSRGVWRTDASRAGRERWRDGDAERKPWWTWAETQLACNLSIPWAQHERINPWYARKAKCGSKTTDWDDGVNTQLGIRKAARVFWVTTSRIQRKDWQTPKWKPY